MSVRSIVRHALLGAAGTTLALVGSLALAPAAQATPALLTGDQSKLTVSGDASCDRTVGKWKVQWTITNGAHQDATITDVTTDPQAPVTVGDPAVDLNGAVIPQKANHVQGSVVATEMVDAAAHSAKLTVQAAWNHVQGIDSSSVKASDTVYLHGSCTPTTNCISADRAHFTHVFDGPAGTATITLDGTTPLCDGQSQKFLLVSYFAPSPRAEWPQYKFDTDVQQIDREHTSIDLAVDVPACFTQVDLVFGDELINPMTANGPRYNDRKLGSGGAPGNRSKGKPAWYNGGTSTCAMPAASMASACEGTVTVHLSNDAAAHYAVPFKVTAGLSGPTFTKEVSVEPGKSVEVVVPKESADKITVTTDGDFVAEGMWQPGHCAPPVIQHKSTCDSLVITVSNPEGNLPAEAVITYGGQTKTIKVDAGKSEEVTFTATGTSEATVEFPDFQQTVKVVYDRPQDCTSPSPEAPSPSAPAPSPSTPDTPGLPVTGVQVGVFAGIGLLLLCGGALLFVMARRRRLTEAQ